MSDEQVPEQTQEHPGTEAEMTPKADHGEQSYKGSGRLAGKRALITGGDSGIGRAVAIAFAREGADVVITHLDAEAEDAQETLRWVHEAGRKGEAIAADLSDAQTCRDVVARTVEALGGLDVLVSNAAYQMSRDSIEEIPDEEVVHTFATNVFAYFRLVQAALPHLGPGASIIGSASIQAYEPSPELLPYAATKAAMVNMGKGFAQALAERGIRANTVAPGPIWTPLIPATMPPDEVEGFGKQSPLGRPGQPAELAPAYVLLASDESSYISAETIGVTGGSPLP